MHDKALRSGDSFNPHRVFHGLFIPNAVAKLPVWYLSHGAKICYGRLVQYAGKNGVAYPKRTMLAKEIGVSPPQVHRFVRELALCEFIKVVAPTGTDRLKHKSTRYLFLWHEAFSDDFSPCIRSDKSEKPVMSAVIKSDKSAVVKPDKSSTRNRISSRNRINQSHRDWRRTFKTFASPLSTTKHKRILDASGEIRETKIKTPKGLREHKYPFHKLTFSNALSIIIKVAAKSNIRNPLPPHFKKWPRTSSHPYYNVIKKILEYLYDLRGNNRNDIRIVFEHYIESRFSVINTSGRRPQPNQLSPTPTAQTYFDEYITKLAEHWHGEGETYWIPQREDTWGGSEEFPEKKSRYPEAEDKPIDDSWKKSWGKGRAKKTKDK